jgi:hypothetical protein
MPVPHKDGISFDGPHDIERLSVDSESLVYETCPIEGSHTHPSGRLWGARRLFYARTFDATVFDEWTTNKKEKIRPEVRSVFWRPGSPAERVYDTHSYVEKLGQVTDSGTCDHCGGTRSRPRCSCKSPADLRGAARRAAAAAAEITVTDDGEILVDDHTHEH